MKIRTLSSNLTAINYSRNRYATSSRTTRIAINARLEWPSPFPNSAENQFLFNCIDIQGWLYKSIEMYQSTKRSTFANKLMYFKY